MNYDYIGNYTSTSYLLVLMLFVLFCYLVYQKRCTAVNDKYKNCQNPSCYRCSKRNLTQIRKKFSRTLFLNESLKQKVRSYLDCKNKEQTATLQLIDNSIVFIDIKETERLQRDVILLEQNFPEIYREYKQLSKNTLLSNSWKTNETPSGKWSAFYLINQGVEVTENISKCPSTFIILQQLETFMSGVMFGNACFSVVYPNTEIPAHCGPCCRARCHLGLYIPKHCDCEITVNNIVRKWKTGKCLIFNDSYEHSVSYKQVVTEGPHLPRVVFMLDLWHPHIADNSKNIIKHIFSV